MDTPRMIGSYFSEEDMQRLALIRQNLGACSKAAALRYAVQVAAAAIEETEAETTSAKGKRKGKRTPKTTD